MQKLGKQTILIVDDEPINIKTLKAFLQTEHKILFATDGLKALEIAQSDEPPDLILLDVMMPGMDGYSVCKKLKSDEKTKNIPVIFITGKTDDDDETKGLEFGAVDYIKKPINDAIVRARVRTHLDLKRHHDFIKLLLHEKTAELEETQKEYMQLFTRTAE